MGAFRIHADTWYESRGNAYISWDGAVDQKCELRRIFGRKPTAEKSRTATDTLSLLITVFSKTAYYVLAWPSGHLRYFHIGSLETMDSAVEHMVNICHFILTSPTAFLKNSPTVFRVYWRFSHFSHFWGRRIFVRFLLWKSSYNLYILVSIFISY